MACCCTPQRCSTHTAAGSSGGLHGTNTEPGGIALWQNTLSTGLDVRLQIWAQGNSAAGETVDRLTRYAADRSWKVLRAFNTTATLGWLGWPRAAGVKRKYLLNEPAHLAAVEYVKFRHLGTGLQEQSQVRKARCETAFRGNAESLFPLPDLPLSPNLLLTSLLALPDLRVEWLCTLDG